MAEFVVCVSRDLREEFWRGLQSLGVHSGEIPGRFDKWLRIIKNRAESSILKRTEITRISLSRLGTCAQLKIRNIDVKYVGSERVNAYITEQEDRLYVLERPDFCLFSSMHADAQHKLRSLTFIQSVEVTELEDFKMINSND